MTTPGTFDALQSILPRRIAPLPDHRKAGPNTPYRSQDAARSAFGIFYTPAPSLLDSQRPLQQAKGHNNVCTLFGAHQLPCDTQGRNRLDPIAPGALDPVFVAVFEALEHQGWLAHLRVLTGQLLIALDGTQYFSSHTIHCQHCRTRQTSKGQPLSYHTAITPVLVAPGRSEVSALPPAYLRPPDGHAKQACERGAGKRWSDHHAQRLAPHGVTFLGDDLSSNQPRCQLALDHGGNFLFVCKPDSHARLYERVAFWQDRGAVEQQERRHWNGRCTAGTRYRSINNGLLRGGRGALPVHWCEITVLQAKTGEQL